MTSSPRPIGRVLVTAAALAVAGLPLLAGGTAQAASTSLSYNCHNDALGDFVATAVIDTDAPATLLAGQSVPIAVTSTVTLPALVGDAVRGAMADVVSGVATSNGTVDGVARTATLTVPKTPVSSTAGTPLVLVGTGPGGSITAGAAGSTITLGAGDFSIVLTAYRDDVAYPKTETVTCALQAGQNLTIDTVLVQAPTTTTLEATSPTEYGATVSATATVATAGTNAKPAGKVAFTYAGKTVTVDVNGGKAKADLGPAVAMGSNSVSAVFTPADPAQAASQATDAFTVTRGSTTTTASTVYRAAKDRIVGKALVEAVHGTEVAGKVKMKLKRNGTLIRTATVTLNAKDKTKKVFKNIRKPGTYVVVAKYLGSPTLKRSKDTAKVVLP